MDSQAVCQIAKELFPIPDSHHQNRELVEKIFLRQKVEYCLQKNSPPKISLQKSYLEHRDISPTRPGIECQTPLFDHYCKSNKNSERLLLDTLIAQFGISTSPFEALPDTATEPVGNFSSLDLYHFYQYCHSPEVYRTNSHGYIYSSKSPSSFPDLILPIQQVSWGGLIRYFNLPPEKVPLCYCPSSYLSEIIILTDDLYTAFYFLHHHYFFIQKPLTVISWYGGLEGLHRLDLQTAIPLKGCQVYFLLSPHAGLTLLQQYQIAYKAYDTLKDIVRFDFLTNIIDGQDADETNIATNLEFEILSFEEFQKRFDALSTSPSQTAIPAYPINRYMDQGGLYIFYPTSLQAKPHLKTVYGTLALGCSQGCLPWRLGTSDRTAFIIHIGCTGQLGENDQKAILLRDSQCIIQNYRLSTNLKLGCEDILEKTLQTYINIPKWKNDFGITKDIKNHVKEIIDKRFTPLPRNQEVIVIFELPDLAEWGSHSPLGQLLKGFARQKFVVWVIFQKVLPPKQLARLDPDGIWEITRAAKAQTLLLQVDIFSKGYCPKSSFELHARRGTELYYLYQPKSKYASLIPIIKKCTMEGYKEVDILTMINLLQDRDGISTSLTLYTLRQLKRQFNIRTYTHVARRRTGISDKIQALHKAGKSPAEIAKLLKLAPYYVRKRLAIIQTKLS